MIALTLFADNGSDNKLTIVLGDSELATVHVDNDSEFGVNLDNLKIFFEGAINAIENLRPFMVEQGMKRDLQKKEEEIERIKNENKEALLRADLMNKELGLSSRLVNCLYYQAEIKTVGEICQCRKNDFYKLRNFGKKSMRELEKFMDDHDLEFYTQLEGYRPIKWR